MSNVKQSKLHKFKIPSSNIKKLLKKLSQRIAFDFLHLTPSPWDHSKSTFAQNFQFLTLPSPSPLFVPVRFTCIPLQRMVALVNYPSPFSKNVPRRL